MYEDENRGYEDEGYDLTDAEIEAMCDGCDDWEPDDELSAEAEARLLALVSSLIGGSDAAEPTVRVLNIERYRDMMRAEAVLHELLTEGHATGRVETKVHPGFCSGAVSAEIDNLCILRPQSFCDLISRTDNFEVYPLTNGKMRLDLTFNGMFSIYEAGE